MTSTLVVTVWVTSWLMTSCWAVNVQITSPSQSVQVSRGDQLNVSCTVSDIPFGQVTLGELQWGRIHGTIEILNSDGVKYVISRKYGVSSVTSQLRILDMTYDDRGSYYCSWVRGNSETPDYLSVTVRGDPEIVSLELNKEPIAGQNLMITCIADGYPAPSIEWTGPRAVTAQLSSSFDVSTVKVNTTRSVSRLTLFNITSQMIGNYRCKAKNSESSIEDDIEVELYPWAHVYDQDQGQRASENGIVTSLGKTRLLCVAYNIPYNVTSKVSWSFKAEGSNKYTTVRNSQSVSIERLADRALTDDFAFHSVTSRLTFHTDFSSQGHYRCRISDSTGVEVAEGIQEVHVEDQPDITLNPEIVAASVGDVVEVVCTVQSRPSADEYFWQMNFRTRLSSRRRRVNDYTTELTLQLKINSTTDFYNYIACVASNSIGESTQALSLQASTSSWTVTWYSSSTTSSTTSTTTTRRPTTSRTPTPTTTADSGQSGGNKGGDSSSNVGLYAGAGAGALVVLVVIIVVIVCVVRRRKQHPGRDGRSPKQYEERIEAPSHVAPPPPPQSTIYSNAAFSPFTDVHDYMPLSKSRSEFPRERLQLLEKLGHGKFGTVLRALALSLHTNGKWDTVAVKMHKEAATDAEKSEFVRELSILRSLPRHQNVVAFLGCCTDDPTLIIMEYCQTGDLLSYLRKRRPDKSAFLGNTYNDLTQRDFFSFALHIARGMAHVARQKIVHRDVAARNVLLTDRNVCKVSDFGLARRVGDDSDVYEIVSRRPLPLRWMSPESLRDGVHTSQSDVWSYGVLLWELVTLGASPYPGNSGKAVIDLVVSGKQPEIPPQCRGELSDIMTSCWKMTPDQRPTFDLITHRFEKLLEQEGDYLQLDNLPEGIYSILEPSVSGERV